MFLGEPLSCRSLDGHQPVVTCLVDNFLGKLAKTSLKEGINGITPYKARLLDEISIFSWCHISLQAGNRQKERLIILANSHSMSCGNGK